MLMGAVMFTYLYEAENDKNVIRGLVSETEWQDPPALMEVLPSGLIEDET
jgi:hypothetical protein